MIHFFVHVERHEAGLVHGKAPTLQGILEPEVCAQVGRDGVILPNLFDDTVGIRFPHLVPLRAGDLLVPLGAEVPADVAQDVVLRLLDEDVDQGVGRLQLATEVQSAQALGLSRVSSGSLGCRSFRGAVTSVRSTRRRRSAAASA